MLSPRIGQFRVILFDNLMTKSGHADRMLYCIVSERALNIAENVSCTQRTYQGKDFELILTVKTESSFGSEFPAICNHCGVMTA